MTVGTKDHDLGRFGKRHGLYQIATGVAIAYIVPFRLLGRDHDAAAVVGGFPGFGISSM